LAKGVKTVFQRREAKTAEVLLLVMLLASAAFAQKQQTAESIAASGTFSGQEYTNSALGFSMLAPGGWSFYNAEQNQSAVQRNRQNASQVRDAKLETSAANTQVLFQAIPPKFAGQDKQAILSAGIEKLVAPTTADKYASDQKALVLGSADAHITKDIYKVTYGGIPFAAFDIDGTRKEGAYRQRYLMTIRRGVALFIVATFFDDRQGSIVEASLKSIRFK
jgi:hypothetical protein